LSIQHTIKQLGFPPNHHDSMRRALQKLLDKSKGPLPKRDITAMIKLLAEGL